MTIELLEVVGIPYAIESARLSYGSKGDSHFRTELERRCEFVEKVNREFVVGPKDRALIEGLAAKSDSEGKSLRMVQCYARIRAPRYWWSQFDTYRIGVEKGSGSTMHTLMNRAVEPDDFEVVPPAEVLAALCVYLESYRQTESRERRIEILREVKALLPEGYLQTRIVMASYQALRHIYRDRRGHKLTEWHQLCDWIETLPHAAWITGKPVD